MVSATRGHKQHWDILGKGEGYGRKLFRMLHEYNRLLHLILNSSKKCFSFPYCFQHVQVGNKPWMMTAQAVRGRFYPVGCLFPGATRVLKE